MKQKTLQKLKEITCTFGELKEKRQKQLRKVNNGFNIEIKSRIESAEWNLITIPNWFTNKKYRLSPSYQPPVKENLTAENDMSHDYDHTWRWLNAEEIK